MGAQLEVAGITDPAAWFWDELGAAPEPEALVDDVLGVEIGVAEPGLVADRWQKLLEVSRPVGDTLELGERFVRFVPPERAPRWRLLVRRAPTGGELSDEIVAGVDVSYF
jgi:hypothetical protein